MIYVCASSPVSSECDSPFTLTNYTLDYIEKEWASEIDFVICRCPFFPPEEGYCDRNAH